MTTEDNEQSPFTKPGFIIAAVVVFLIVVLGVVIGFVNANRNDPEPAPSSSSPTNTSAAPTTEPSAVAGGASVCGLGGEVLSGSLTTAPEAKWEYMGTTAYPTSAKFGPAEKSEKNYRYCFQHSPEGAVFAAANALVQGSSPEVSGPWIEYFLSAKTPNRSDLLTEVSSGASSETRMSISGFKILEYDGKNARIDLAAKAVGSGNSVYASAVYDLVWEDGDWKLLPQNPSNPLRIAQIPDVSGYVAWGE